MHRALVRFAAVVLAFAVVLTAVPGLQARERALERALGDAYAAGEAAQIERAFRAATKGGVRDRDALELVKQCVEGEFDADQVARVLSLAAQLALEELPVEGFLDKVGEGIAKRVPPERVVQAAERRALTLNRARGLVNAAVLGGADIDDRDEVLVDVAGALEAGRDEDEVREALGAGGRPREIRRKLFP